MQYNTTRYNEQQYQYQLLAEILSLSDTIVKDSSINKIDALFINDQLTKQIINKGLFDNIRLADWVSKNRNIDIGWTD
jgi:hypothetical protein